MTQPSTFAKTVATIREEGPVALARKIATRTRILLEIAAATVAVRTKRDTAGTPDADLDFAFAFGVGAVNIRPTQIRSEIAALLELLRAEPPETLLEIGTARGGTLFLLGRVAHPHASMASIDLPGGTFGGGYERAWIPLLRALRRPTQSLRLIRADSHLPETQAEARRWLGDRQLDFLLIDGDHTLEGVTADFETYGPLVRDGGMIAIHDIAPGRVDRVGGVPAFWQSIKGAYQTRELVEDWAQGGFGLGVVVVPEGGIAAAGS